MTTTHPLRVEIYSDVVCPWCFIGKRRFESALAERPDVEVSSSWMPFQLNPDMPSEGMDRQHYLETKFGGAENAERVYAPIVAAGAELNLAFRFDRIARTPNTLNAHRLIHYASMQPPGQDPLVEHLFDAYFLRGENIGDLDVLEAVAIEAGLAGPRSRAYLESDEDLRKVEAQDVMARQVGIQGVPFFVVERKYAVSGAQSPEVFVDVLDKLAEEAAAAV